MIVSTSILFSISEIIVLKLNHHMSRGARKPVFGVSDQVRSDTKRPAQSKKQATGLKLAVSRRGIVLSE